MNTRKDLARQLNDELGPLTFGRFLRGARTAQDRTQVEMAKLLGISHTTLCDIERGRQVVSPQLAARIARKCGMSEVLAVETALTDQLRRAKLPMRVHVQPDQQRSPRVRAPARTTAKKVKPAMPLAAKRRAVSPAHLVKKT